MSYMCTLDNPGNGSYDEQNDYQFDPYALPPSMDESDKFRQLPCRTFVAVGTCPYRDRCVYLHDPRILCKDAKTKTRKKNKDDIIADSLFWPVMNRLDLNMKYDNALQVQPHVVQPYHVPIPIFASGVDIDRIVPANLRNTYTGNNPHGTGFGVFHDRCLYSTWMHFVDYCMKKNEIHTSMNDEAYITTNKYLGTSRLPFFVALSQGHTNYTNSPLGSQSPTIEVKSETECVIVPTTPIAELAEQDKSYSPTSISLVESLSESNINTMNDDSTPNPKRNPPVYSFKPFPIMIKPVNDMMIPPGLSFVGKYNGVNGFNSNARIVRCRHQVPRMQEMNSYGFNNRTNFISETNTNVSYHSSISSMNSAFYNGMAFYPYHNK